MRGFIVGLILLAFAVAAVPAEAGRRGYYDANGNWVSTRSAYSQEDYGTYRSKVRSHKRRRNVLLGVGALGLVTHSGGLTAIGLGGAAANHFIDRDHRDY